MNGENEAFKVHRGIQLLNSIFRATSKGAYCFFFKKQNFRGLKTLP